MVSIVSQIPHPSVVKEVVCRNCRCTLSYVPKDVQQKTYRDISGVSDVDYWIDCPSCDNRVAVSRP